MELRLITRQEKVGFLNRESCRDRNIEKGTVDKMSTEELKTIMLKVGKKKIENMEDLKNAFRRVCTNAFLTNDNGECVMYRREDLYKWSKEAFERGDTFFYAEAVNKNDPNGKLRLCEPKYEYKLRSLSEEEFKKLFS